ncbi:Uncharacterised protein [Mycobacteroides abscessus subsp. massiliense]|nr:Uncharacterised protein [Mycobacteroides abscessus subsp. massiliense]
MLLRETEDYEKYYKIGNVVMGTAFICIVIFSLMKSTPLSDKKGETPLNQRFSLFI